MQRKDILEEREFSILVLNTEICSFDFDFDPRGLKVYYLGERLMRQMGARFDAVVAVIPVEQLRVGMTVLVSEEQEIAIGKVQFENFTRLFFILDENQKPIVLDEKKVIGEPVGYCLMENAGREHIRFSRLPL